MCGIAGIVGSEDKDALIGKMTDAIYHRGPDDDGYFTDEKVALGMRRLSIIDPSKGKQPISSDDGNLTIFFNGEIYNYKELRDELIKTGHNFKTESDTEVVLCMFEVYGTESFSRLRGMFAIAIYNKITSELILARDFFGIKPLYYMIKETNMPGVVAFSSEIKSFLTLPWFKPEVNDAAVYNYLSFQYNPLEETFFKNIFKLPPAHYMRIDTITGREEIKKYWQFEFKQNNSLDEESTRQKVLETMKDSVAHHMIADVPVGSFLSGGIDSSIIATLMQKIRGAGKVKTFTVGFESLSEGKEAKETVDSIESDHREITISAEEYFASLPKVIWHFDEPVADPSALGLYFLAREAAKDVKVVLSGEGSDELFGGYNIYLEPFARQKIVWFPRFLLNFLVSLPFEFKGKNYARRASQKLEDWYIGNASIFKENEVAVIWQGNNEKKFSLKNMYKEVLNSSDSTKMQYIDINTWLVGDILAKADKMTMAHSLELRVPFLDIRVADLAQTLPDRFKWVSTAKQSITKYILREAFKDILPESVRKRKKLGFPTPIRDWFTKEREDIYDIIVNNSYIRSRMNLPEIRKIIEDHVSKKADNSRKIYLLLVLAIWYNTFIDGHS